MNIYSLSGNGWEIADVKHKSNFTMAHNYVWDMWVNVLGVDVLGLYTVYTRLAREGKVFGIGQDKLSKILRIASKTLRKHNGMLEECGFIRIESPDAREKHPSYSNVIHVLEPPAVVSKEIIEKYLVKRGGFLEYQNLCSWLCGNETKTVTVDTNNEDIFLCPEATAHAACAEAHTACAMEHGACATEHALNTCIEYLDIENSIFETSINHADSENPSSAAVEKLSTSIVLSKQKLTTQKTVDPAKVNLAFRRFFENSNFQPRNIETLTSDFTKRINSGQISFQEMCFALKYVLDSFCDESVWLSTFLNQLNLTDHMRLIIFINARTDGLAAFGKESAAAKKLSKHIDLGRVTLQEIEQCFDWMIETKSHFTVSLMSVISVLPNFRLNPIKPSQNKFIETLKERDYDKLAEIGAAEYERRKAEKANKNHR